MATTKKYSVSLPEELGEEIRERVGAGAFSAYVAEALEHRLAMEKLGEIVQDYELHHGPLSQEAIDAAAAVLTAPIDETASGESGAAAA